MEKRPVGNRLYTVRTVPKSDSDWNRFLHRLTVLDTKYSFDATDAYCDSDSRRTRLALPTSSASPLSIARPLPHQLEAVTITCSSLLVYAFCLPMMPAPGKTIMSGLLTASGTARPRRMDPDARPANLFVAVRVKEKFGYQVRCSQGTGHPRPVRRESIAGAWSGHGRLTWRMLQMTPGLLGPRHCGRHMSASDESHKSMRYSRRAITPDHLLLLTATPHKGDPGTSAYSCSSSTSTPTQM